MSIPAGTRLLFIGDSVTDCGRARPVGEGPAALGDGYVAQVAGRIAVLGLDPPVRVVNMGISGNTVRDLAGRWEQDVTLQRPDWLCVMIGINDVWRQFDGVDRSAAVPPDEFERTLGSLLAGAGSRVRRLVVMTPFYIQADRADPMRRRMDEYGALVRRVAARHGLPLGDTQAAFDAALAGAQYEAIAPDRVHPTRMGHAILADVFCAAAGLRG